MHIRPRPLLLALGALLLPALPASAQFVELLAEAPVTVTGSITTTRVSETATNRTTSQTVTSLQHAAVIADILAYLRENDLVAPDAPATGWSLVAVGHAPADLAYVDAGAQFYLVNGSTRVKVPDAKLVANARRFASVAKYKESSLGRYVLSSSGTVTNHVSYNYAARLTVGDTTYAVTDSLTDGYATIAYKSVDSANGFEVYFLAVSSLRASVRGSFTASTSVGDVAGPDSQGLITLSLNIGAAKLVPATNYPDVPAFPEGGF